MNRLTLACGPLALVITMAACAPALLPLTTPEPILAREIRPAPKPAAGACWARLTLPAVIETVTDQVRTDSAAYQTETRQRIIKPQSERWFRAPCPEEMTPDLIATLQRALKVRGLYRGPVSGVMDAGTSAAVRAWQAPRGLNSAHLSLRAAQELGLLPWPRPLAPQSRPPDLAPSPKQGSLPPPSLTSPPANRVSNAKPPMAPHRRLYC